MVFFIKYFWRKLVLWGKKSKTFNSVILWLRLFKEGKSKKEWTVRMKSIFLVDWIYKCVLLQVLTEAAIKFTEAAITFTLCFTFRDFQHPSGWWLNWNSLCFCLFQWTEVLRKAVEWLSKKLGDKEFADLWKFLMPSVQTCCNSQ